MIPTNNVRVRRRSTRPCESWIRESEGLHTAPASVVAVGGPAEVWNGRLRHTVDRALVCRGDRRGLVPVPRRLPRPDRGQLLAAGGEQAFRALTPGEPFFLKSHHPHNQVVGGGFYSAFARLRLSEAWDFFGPGNGATDIAQMRERIGRYRRTPIGPGDDPVIGCVLLRDVRFFLDTPAEPPPDFARNIVQGRRYDLADPAYAGYFTDLLHRLLGATVDIDLGESWSRTGPVYGDPRLVSYRLGQQALQAVVLDAYERHCAITGSKIRPVLQAAHVRPLAVGGQHRLDNGLLLLRRPHPLRPRLPRRRPPSPPAGQPAAA